MAEMMLRLHLFCLLLLTLLAGCQRQLPSESASRPASPAAPAPASAPATAPQPRIISLSPAGTLMLLQLRAGPELVGVSSFDKPNLPPELQNLPIAGDYLNINYETIVSLHPTAIVVQISDARLAPRLKELTAKKGIALINIRTDTLDDIFDSAERLGQIAGRTASAQAIIAHNRAELNMASKITRSTPVPRVIMITWQDPISIVGSGGFLDEMITAAGGLNAGAAVGPGYPAINREVLVQLRPDVLLIAAPDQPAQQPDDPRLSKWRSLPIPAAEKSQIFLLTNPTLLMGSLDVGSETLSLIRHIRPFVAVPIVFPDANTAGAGSATAPGTAPSTSPAPAGDTRP